MITIYFDPLSNKWFHTTSHHSFSWGHHQFELPFRSNADSPVFFSMQLNKGNVGPIVGVLTNSSVLRNLTKKTYSYFVDLHKSLQNQGGLLVIFSLQNIFSTFVNGMVYTEQMDKWLPATVPIPNVIYNRIPTRNQERTTLFHSVMKRLQGEEIPFFNQRFFSKWETYQLLLGDSLIKHYLPETVIYSTKQTIEQMLEKHSFIYVKPVEGCRGKGIFQLQKTENGAIQFKNIQHTILYQDMHSLLKSHPLNDKWLIQQGIHSDLNEGKRYDLRIIVVRQNQHYTVSGIGIRQSVTQDVTTHVPNGGIVVPLSAIQKRLNLPLIKRIASACGNPLSKKYGLVGEYSIDMTKSADGHYYVLEANAKPMIFDETHIQQKRLEDLCSLFYSLTAFQP